VYGVYYVGTALNDSTELRVQLNLTQGLFGSEQKAKDASSIVRASVQKQNLSETEIAGDPL